MPLPNLIVPAFPNVPNVPGVPPVPRSALNAISQYGGLGGLPLTLSSAVSVAGSLIAADSVSLPAQNPPPVWGIFDSSNNQLATWDSVLGFEFRAESKVSDYPQENGTFASYNKVKVPYDARMRISKGGASADRASLLQAIDAAKNSTSLYTVVTPEITYPNASIVHYDYRREHREGATLLVVDIWMEEIRVTAVKTFSNSAAPAGRDPVYAGPLGATVPSNSQLLQIGTPVNPGTIGSWSDMLKTQ